MSIRELTKEEEDRLLTSEELLSLSSGTELMIKWRGGNGPWLYKIINDNGKYFADNCYMDEIIPGKHPLLHDRVFFP